MQKAISSKQYRKLLVWLKAARAEQGLTLRELAVLLDESHSVVGKIETGERRLDIYEYIQYCKVLKVDPKAGLKLLE
jgi:transcriptional regulator with XRE-family HTH domain